MILSILIPTIPERKEVLRLLLNELENQRKELNAYDKVQILVHETPMMFNGGPEIGTKRQYLIEKAIGKYVVFIDCDDMVSPDYLVEILKGAETDCDVMGSKGYMTTNGGQRTPWIIHLNAPYALINGIYYRHPNHLSPIKREIALQIGYTDKSAGEDYEYSVKLKESGICKTEYMIEKEIYHYQYSTHAKTHP